MSLHVQEPEVVRCKLVVMFCSVLWFVLYSFCMGVRSQ